VTSGSAATATIRSTDDSQVVRDRRDTSNLVLTESASEVTDSEALKMTWIPDIANVDTVTKLPIDYYEGDSAEETGFVPEEAVFVPPSDMFQSDCVISEIDPNSSPSSEAFEVRGIVDDCASLCDSETLFTCNAYTFGGPGTYCVLHGQLDKFKVKKMPGSPYSITDVNCVNGNAEESQLQLCSFNLLKSGISLEGLIGDVREMSALNKDHCEAYCNMRPYGSICTSYLFDPTMPSIGSINCVLMSRDNLTVTIFNPGNADFYENPCAVSDFSR